MTVVLSALIGAIFLCTPVANAQEVLIKSDDFYAELFLKIPASEVLSVEQVGSAIKVTFKKSIKTPFSKKLDNKFITFIEGGGDHFTIAFPPNYDFAAFRDPEGIKFVSTSPKEKDNVLLSYGVGAPLLRKNNRFSEDPVLDALLKEADNAFKNGAYSKAAGSLNKLLDITDNPYYEQEAMFRLGNTYMEMGDFDPDAYVNAAAIMDKFLLVYPESSRTTQALLMSAQAKYLSGQMADAINQYEKIYKDSADSETKRIALERIGDMYADIGQNDKAIAAYERYLSVFKSDGDRIKAKAGGLYIISGYKDKAYNVFKGITKDNISEVLTNAQLLSMAKIFEEKGDKAEALDLYKHLISAIDITVMDSSVLADNPELPEALYRYANLNKEMGLMDNYNNTIRELSTIDPTSSFGHMALVEFAEHNYKERSANEWEIFLAPVFEGEDIFNLQSRAMLVLIGAMEDDGETTRMVSLIDRFIQEFPSSPELPRLLKLKEDSLFDLANSLNAENNGTQAIGIYQQILREFPTTARKKPIMATIDDIKYKEAMNTYTNKNYKQAVSLAENRFLEEPPAGERWYSLWDDAFYNKILAELATEAPQIIRLKAREYMSQLPRGKYINDIRKILATSFATQFNDAYDNGRDAETVSLYNENYGWLADWNDQELNNKAKTATANALLRLNMPDKARELFRTITPMMNGSYAELGYSLCEKFIYDVNLLTPEEFQKVIQQGESCGISYTLDLAKGYTKDPKLSTAEQYNISKIIPDDRMREAVLKDIYTSLSSGSSAQFDGYNDVFMDVGMISFRKNDFRGSVMPLKRYIDNSPNDSSGNNEKKAEAIYHLAKSLQELNEKDKAMEYFQLLVDTIPNSIYKNLAKSELEDYQWRKSISK